MEVKKYIQKYKVLFSAILILLCFAGLIVGVNELQVTFTFSNVYKLHNGIQLYSQNNVIDTPLYFYLANAFLSIFGFNFFSYKLFAIVIFEIICLLSLNILRKLNVSTTRAVIYIILIVLPFSRDFYQSGASYNILALLFWLLGMYLIIRKEKFEVRPLEQGGVAALVFATKQNIGIYYLIGLSIFTIYNYRKDIKSILKKLFSTYAIFLCITLTWIAGLAIQGQFKDFINYCFLGIGEFARSNISVNSGYIIFYCIPFLTIITLVLIKKKFKLTSESKFVKSTIFFLCFMFPSLLMGYPIFNTTHIILATFVPVLYCVYFIEQLVSRMKELFDLKIIKIILIGYLLVVIALNLYYIFDYGGMLLNKDYTYTYDNPFFGTSSTEELNDKIEEVVNFVKQKESDNQNVVIFSTEANLYQLVLNGNNQDFDLPLLGNWGYKGEERVLNKIKNLENTFILINDEDLVGQESKTIKTYIRNNYNKTGEIADFEIYYIE